MSYTRRAVRGTALVFIINVIAAFVGYLIRMVLARNLTPAEYGLFFAVLTLINFLAIFKSLGLGSALIKYIPEFQVKNKLNLIKNSIVIVIGYNVFFSLILAVAMVLASKWLAIYYFKDASAVLLIWIFGLMFIISNFAEHLRNVFNAFQKMLPFSLMYLFENLFILIISIILFYFNFKILSPVFAYIITSVLLFFIFFPSFLKIFPFFKYKFEYSSKLTKKLFKFGLPLTLLSIGIIVILYTDTLILTYFRSLDEVGIYNAVVPTAMLLSFFGGSVIQVIFPMVSELWAKKLRNHIQLGVIILYKYLFIIMLPVALVILSFPKLILRILFGEAYVSGALALQLLVIGVLFFAFAGINMYILSAIGKPKISAKIMLAGALLNLITNFYFIPKYGMNGAAITSLFSYFFIFLLSIFYLNKFIKLKIPWFNWIKTSFSGLIFVLIIYLLKLLININVYLEAITCVIVAGLLYLSLIFLFKIASITEIKGLLITSKV